MIQYTKKTALYSNNFQNTAYFALKKEKKTEVWSIMVSIVMIKPKDFDWFTK